MSKKLSEVIITQPLRLTQSYQSYTPLQADIVTLIQREIQTSKEVLKRLTIDLKPYFEYKGYKSEDQRVETYKKVIEQMSELSVHYSPDYTRPELITTSIISAFIHQGNFKFEVVIPNTALPLFYINKFTLKQNWWNSKEDEIFEMSTEKELKYSSKKDIVSIDLKSTPEKRLYEELIRHKQHGKYEFVFSKLGLYKLLGYLEVRKKPEDELRLFPHENIDLVQTKYKGSQGWQTLSKYLNKWLENISVHPTNGITLEKIDGKKYFKTFGRPIKKITIKVVYDKSLVVYNDEQKLAYRTLIERYHLSKGQAEMILSKYTPEEIKKIIASNIAKKEDQKRITDDQGMTLRYDKVNTHYININTNQKIDNLPGFIYAILFKMKK